MNKEKVRDIVKDFIFFIITTVIAFAYWMLVLLIISFITLSFLHFTIEGIFIAAILGTLCVDIYYIWKTVKKYRKAAEEELRRSEM